MSQIWPVHLLGTIDSTNNEAKRRAKAGAFEDCWLVAEAQTAGRGRLERNWVSPNGNLYATALFHEPGGIQVASRIPFAAALAVSDVALRFAPKADVLVKWPNDVRIGGAKLSGILIETGASGRDVWVASGIGINVVETPAKVTQSAISMNELTGAALTLDSGIVLQALREAFAERLAQARQGFATLREDWLKRAEGLGQTVRVSPGTDVIEGTFVDMAPDGGLVLKLPDGSHKTIRAGDVDLVRRV